MRRHRMTSHPETIDKTLHCTACDKEFLSSDGLKRHHNLMHDYRAEQKVPLMSALRAFYPISYL
jgi:hypothetical protein